ncbi:hypothetical protein [Tessaracoccus sp. ZS01]|uniref:hypothetical protein n=1 Tax=Tessaracoccus sp. ZS01 TaxID=1906324 RepID=UPI00096C31B7|nr:hypothetical protein [Tessaracoccus sp. ZS01]MCG6568595.1 hypothetical protein [Tessaracoccus sp. ZS01]OMG52264.1 hypothetical protein BJN44_13325 [Tessaracoccus sp. ZS01]
MFKTVRVALAALLAVTGAVVLAPNASAEPVDVYSTPGEHTVNGRQWRTTCEPYSVTKRCRTEIMATVVSWDGAKFVQKNGWVFNNLTYLPAPVATWKGNPLATHNMNGFVSGGRNWRTECNTATTGQGGCRSYIQADVIAKTASGFTWQTQWVFNSMVRFSTNAPKPVPTDPTEPIIEPHVVPIAPSDAPAIAGWEKESVEGLVSYTKASGDRYALVVVMALGDIEGGSQALIADMTNTENVGSAVCGTIEEIEAEACVLTTATYGTVIVMAESATRAELLEVTLKLDGVLV